MATTNGAAAMIVEQVLLRRQVLMLRKAAVEGRIIAALMTGPVINFVCGWA